VKDRRVLILGATGSVGLVAVQFAKLAGIYVVGTASGKNEERLKEMGIDEVVDCHKTSIRACVTEGGHRKFD
jgi:NADPH:quinone reductase-like Zn-dependent oxidoreductase